MPIYLHSPGNTVLLSCEADMPTNNIVGGMGMAKGRYYVEGFLIGRRGFKRTGKLTKQLMGTSASNWINENGSILVERRQVGKQKVLHIYVGEHHFRTFNISLSNPERDNEIKAFEQAITLLSMKRKDIDEDDLDRIKDCLSSLASEKPLDSTQSAFLISLKG